MRASDQKGITDIELIVLVVFVVLITAIAVPTFVSWRKNSKIPAAVTELRQIAKAQADYRSKISLKGTYGSLDDLKNAKLLGADFPGYELNRNYEETLFCARAENYVVGIEGKIYEGASLGCRAGEITGGELTEVK